MKLLHGIVIAGLFFACSVSASEVPMPTDRMADRQFDQMKSLVGRWRVGSGGAGRIVTFQVVAKGSALLETESNGGEVSITLIYPAGGELRADHYCNLKTQSHLVATPNAYSGLIRFQPRDRISVPPHSRYHGALMVRFLDPDHHTEFWREIDDSGRTIQLVGVQLTRVR